MGHHPTNGPEPVNGPQVLFVFGSRQFRARFLLGQVTESPSRVTLLLLACSLLGSVPSSVTSGPLPHPVMRNPAHDPEEPCPFPADDSSGFGQPPCPFSSVLVAMMTAHSFFFFLKKEKLFFFLCVLAAPGSMQDLRSPTGDQTCTPRP